VAGNPAGLRLEEARNGPSVGGGLVQAPFERPFSPPTPQPSPLIPVSALGPAPSCPGPPPTRLTYTPEYHSITSAGAELWSSIAVLPSDEALAGGKMWGATEGAQAPAGEPVIARANCEGATTLTRFTEGSSGPADPAGDITALAAGSANEAWATSSEGRIGGPTDSTFELPHLYRLTNGEPPEGPEEDEEEPQRHHEEEEGAEEEPPVYVEPPPAPVPVEAPPRVTRTRTTLAPPIYDVKTRLRTTRRQAQVNLSLYITFHVRRPVTIGAQALRYGRVVSVARPRRFAGHTGQLVLSLDRKHWPTKVAFIS
jgi:hypothetical protein